MLIEFSVGNYRSFKEKVVFSMEATNISSLPKSLDEQNVFCANSDLNLLTSAALYGANASGKSNLIKALAFMRHLVLSSSRETQIEEEIEVEPFLLSQEVRSQSSFFEIVFIINGDQYRYGFEVNSRFVVSEWFYKLGSLRELTLFKRDSDNLIINPRNFREGRGLETRTRPNALFLSVAAQFNGTISTQILKWFRTLSVNPGIDDTGEMASALYNFENSPHRKAIEHLIKRLDVSIEGLDFERTPIANPQKLPKELIQQFAMFLEPSSSPGYTFNRVSIKTYHNVFNNKGQSTGTKTFDLEEHESAGTRRLFALAHPLLKALKEGSVLVIDEMDARIHPNLTIELIRLFNSKETNSHHAQLVFTTHNTNLLSAELFRRDQIWFVEKSRQGASDLYSLVEYREDGKIVRNDASFEKDYISGRYGAIPFLGDLSTIMGVDVEKATT